MSYYFGEAIENEVRKERTRLQLSMIGVPLNIANLVVDFEDKYIEEFKQRVLNGQDPTLAYSVQLNIILLDRIKEKDEHIEGLVNLNDQLEESCAGYYSKLEKLEAENKELRSRRYISPEILKPFRVYSLRYDGEKFNVVED